MAIEVEVLFNRLPEIAAGLTVSTELGVDSGLAIVEQAVKDNAPTATGALQASVYRMTRDTDEYDGAVAEMESLNPRALASERPDRSGGEGILGVAADYAAPVNDGHVTANGGFVAANPFFTQAVESNQEKIVEEAIKAINAEILKHSFGL